MQQAPQTHGGILRKNALIPLIGLSRSTIERLEAAGDFPKRIALGARAVGYRQAEIEQWMNTRATKVSAK